MSEGSDTKPQSVVIDISAYETRFGFGGDTSPIDKFPTIVAAKTNKTEKLPVESAHAQIAVVIASSKTIHRLKRKTNGVNKCSVDLLPPEIIKRILHSLEPAPARTKRLYDGSDREPRGDGSIYFGESALGAFMLGTRLQRSGESSPLLFSSFWDNWDALEQIIHHVFYAELKVAPEECVTIMPVKQLQPKANRERMVQIMFETFNVPLVFMGDDAYFALLGCTSKATGVVVDIGENSFTVTPLYEGLGLPHATEYRLGHGQSFNSYVRSERAFDNAELSLTERTLPSRARARFSVRRDENDHETRFWELPELLFFSDTKGQTTFMNIPCERANIPQIVKECIDKCDESIRQELWSNVVLVGGTSKMTNLADRFERELRDIAPEGIREAKWGITRGDEHSTFHGASLMSHFSDDISKLQAGRKFMSRLNLPFCMTKDFYDEDQPPPCILRRF